MTGQWRKRESGPALLPKDADGGRPLFMVLAILAFLVTLSLFGVKTSFQSAQRWMGATDNVMSVQVKYSGADDIAAQAELARTIIQEQAGIISVRIVPQAQSRKLLEPWLGSAELPAGLPVPALLDVRLKPGEKLDEAALSAALVDAGIRADIDNHSQWRAELSRTVRSLQAFTIWAFLLVTIAIVFAAIFAVHAGVARHRRIIDVLHQVGADLPFTARLFSGQFAKLGGKAGGAGALGALITVFILGLFASVGARNSQLIPLLKLGMGDVYIALFVPILMALLCAFIARRTIGNILINEVYP